MLFRSDPRAALARKIARWLIRFPDVVAFTERQAHAGVKVEGLRADDVRSALSLLDEYGYVRRAPPVVLDTRGPGRPASPTWLVNPRWERAH